MNGEGFKYKYIPRHAPSYHIDLAIVTILSSPAMSGCTIAAGGKGMPASEEACGRVRGMGGNGRKRGKGERQVVPHGVPRHPTMRADVGRRGLNVRARARGKAPANEEEGDRRGSRRGRR